MIIDIYIYIYKERERERWGEEYHTMTDVYTATLLPTKPSSDENSGFTHGFRIEASLPLTQSTLEVLFTNPSARAGYDTRSIFKRSLTGFEFRVFLLLD